MTDGLKIVRVSELAAEASVTFKNKHTAYVQYVPILTQSRNLGLDMDVKSVPYRNS